MDIKVDEKDLINIHKSLDTLRYKIGYDPLLIKDEFLQEIACELQEIDVNLDELLNREEN